MPFADLTDDPRRIYFANGVAEELRDALGRLPKLRAIARSSSEALRDADVFMAARQLDVAHILTGSVRRSPSSIRGERAADRSPRRHRAMVAEL